MNRCNTKGPVAGAQFELLQNKPVPLRPTRLTIGHRRRLTALGLITGLACLASASAFAQAAVALRQFPAGTEFGDLQITAPPDAVFNGQPDRLSPGARIRGTNGMLVLSGELSGQAVAVRLLREPNRLIHEVWILTPDEIAALPRAPRHRNAVAPNGKPAVPRDDGKTPFDKLPKWPNQ